jgi:hypothetical protein
MTDLSPAAQAVLDAYMNNCGWLDGPLEKDYRCTAAVLRAVVQELKYFGITEKNILAMAAELEGTQT